MKMRFTYFFVIMLCLSACTPSTTAITEEEVVETLNGFFAALDVENEDPMLIDSYVTEDFLIYEAGKIMNKAEFTEFVQGATIDETNWVLSDFRISIDKESAHASLRNKGRFVTKTDTSEVVTNIEWLESAYLVMEDEKLKIKFYFSDNIGSSSE